jgi:transposase
LGKKTISDEKKALVKTLADSGMPYRKIQEIIPVSLGQISNIIKEFESNRKLVEYYKKNRADLLAFDQMVYRSHITQEKLEKASARDLEIMRGISHDHERLERGQSTENVHLLIEAIEDLKRRRAKNEA